MSSRAHRPHAGERVPDPREWHDLRHRGAHDGGRWASAGSRGFDSIIGDGDVDGGFVDDVCPQPGWRMAALRNRLEVDYIGRNDARVLPSKRMQQTARLGCKEGRCSHEDGNACHTIHI